MDSAAWDARYSTTELVWSVAPNRFVEEECGGLPPGVAVDLAAGEGRNAIWLAQQGWRVSAVDFSQVALDKGRRLAERAGVGGSVDWVRGDATTWRAPTPADLVVIAYLQLPAAERTPAVRGGFAALKPGGTLLVVAHDSTNLTEGTGGPQDPAVLYTAQDVLDDLAGERLTVERAERVTRPVPAGDEHRGESDRTAYDALVRVRRAG